MTTLVIRFSALGDVAMLASVLREAVAAHPEEHYIVLSREKMRPLFAETERVAFISNTDDIPWKTIDRVVDAHSVWRSWIIDILSLCHLKPIRCIRKERLKKYIRIHLLHNRLQNEIHITSALDRYRQLLDVNKSYYQPTISVNCTLQIGIAPFAAHKGKIYPLDKMEEVIRQLNEQGLSILLFGAGEKEKETLDAWEKKYTHVTSLAGKFSLAEELQIMRSLRLMLTMDSGNMHLASLVGTRVISIWGATDPAMGFLGYGQNLCDCIMRKDLPCRPCSIYGNTTCQYGDYRCLNITPQQILHQLEVSN